MLLSIAPGVLPVPCFVVQILLVKLMNQYTDSSLTRILYILLQLRLRAASVIATLTKNNPPAQVLLWVS